MERKQFLGRVSAALRNAQLPDVSGPGFAPQIRFADPVATFVAEARAVAADVVRLGADEVFGTVARIFELIPATSYIAWDRLDDVAPGWSEWAAATGLQRVDATVRPGVQERKDDHARVGAVRVGITTADFGVAASGSIVLCHGEGRPRSASLLVESHIVLLPAKLIVASLGEALDGVSWAGTSNIAVITGPSRTGDIDSVLTLGVHGPRHVHILVIE